MSRKKTCLRGLVFIAGFVLLLTALSVAFTPAGNRKADGMLDHTANAFVAEAEDTIDTLFIGDSLSYSSFIPKQMWQEGGLTAYVCGTPRQSLNRSLDYLLRFNEKQSPKLVILEANAIFQYDRIKSDVIDLFHDTMAGWFPVFNHHNYWQQLVTGGPAAPAQPWRHVQKGYRFINETVPWTGEDYMADNGYRVKFPPLAAYYLKQIHAYCTEQNIQLMLISSPCPKNWSYARSAAVRDKSAALDIPYLDLNLRQAELGMDWQNDTSDGGDHLNYTGARKVTAFLTAYLKDHYSLQDHRGDGRYAQWQADCETAERQIDEALALGLVRLDDE